MKLNKSYRKEETKLLLVQIVTWAQRNKIKVENLNENDMREAIRYKLQLL